MAWFSKRSKGADDPADAGPVLESSAEMDVADPSFEGRPVARPLTADEQQRIASALDALAGRGVDVDDLSSIGAAYDASCAAQKGGDPGEARDACELIGIAIGEHLHRHSTLKWAIVTDTFGTDLGLAAARSETVVVPHNLVSARWMRRETGWIPRVVEHLLRINARR
jgi:hypothetical protein